MYERPYRLQPNSPTLVSIVHLASFIWEGFEGSGVYDAYMVHARSGTNNTMTSGTCVELLVRYSVIELFGDINERIAGVVR